jgi:hypothetical protein
MQRIHRPLLAAALACGPVGPGSSDTSSTIATSAPDPTTSTGPVATSTPDPTSTATSATTEPGTTSGTTVCDDSTTTGDPLDPDEAALALECLSRPGEALCEQPVPEGSPGHCVWMAAKLFPPCTTDCAAAEPTSVCVAIQHFPETGCSCPCPQYWHDTPDGLVLIPPDDTLGSGFCFDFPVGWHHCSDDRPECACCVDDCF